LIQAQKEAASELAPTQAHCVFACDAWRLLLKKGIKKEDSLFHPEECWKTIAF